MTFVVARTPRFKPTGGLGRANIPPRSIRTIEASMKYIGPVLSAISCIAGLYAAYLWARASGIGPQFSGTEPGTEEGSQMWQTSAMMEGNWRSGAANKRAAFWTAISVGLSGTSSVFGWF
jgi:hypothetical protein